MSTQAPRRALIVIDVQNEYIDGNFRIEYPSVRDSLPRIQRAMDLAVQQGIPIVVVQHVAGPDSPIFARGTRGAELHPAIATRHRDLLLTKTSPSCFSGTRLGEWLDDRAIDTLAVVGYMTHNCNESTIREAAHRALHVELLHDAAGSLAYSNRAGRADAAQLHRVSCVVLQSAYAAVMSTEEWVHAVTSGALPERDNIYVSHQRAIRQPVPARYARKFDARWSDMDANGHMRNTAYLDKAVDVRHMFMNDSGFAPAEFMRLGVGPIVMKDELNYFKELRLQQAMEVTLELAGSSVDGSRFLLRHEVTRDDGTLSARITSTGGWLDLAERTLVRPPPAILAAMEKLGKTSDFAVLASNVPDPG